MSVISVSVLFCTFLLCIFLCVWFSQGTWITTGWTMRLGIAVRCPQCLWWDMWSLNIQFPFHFTILCFIYAFACFFSFFYPMPVGNSQRGKRKTSEQAVLSDSNTLAERQKKMVRFGGHSLEEDLEWSEPQIKDSGVDTCSSTTLNEEHSHSKKVQSLYSLHSTCSFGLCLLSVTHCKRTGSFQC